MENNEVYYQLKAEIESLSAKIGSVSDKLNGIEAKLGYIESILSTILDKNSNKDAILGRTSAKNSEINDSVIALFHTEIRKQEKLDFRESVPAQLTKIMCFIAERKNASSTDIKLHLSLGQPTYRRFIDFLRKWNWIELTPGSKKGNFILSKKGKELMDKFLLSNK
jgi:predicted transcriptional regulator